MPDDPIEVAPDADEVLERFAQAMFAADQRLATVQWDSPEHYWRAIADAAMPVATAGMGDLAVIADQILAVGERAANLLEAANQTAAGFAEQVISRNAAIDRLSLKLREMASRVTMWRRCAKKMQAERDEARNTFLDHYSGASGHLDRIRQLEEELRKRTGERDAARAELADVHDGYRRALERKKQLTAELTEARRKAAALRAQLARARVFPEDYQRRLLDLPWIGKMLVARVTAEIESWPRPQPLTAEECVDLSALLLGHAEHVKQQAANGIAKQENENA